MTHCAFYSTSKNDYSFLFLSLNCASGFILSVSPKFVRLQREENTAKNLVNNLIIY